MIRQFALILLLLGLAAPSVAMAACHEQQAAQMSAMAGHGGHHDAPDELPPQDHDAMATNCLGCSVPARLQASSPYTPAQSTIGLAAEPGRSPLGIDPPPDTPPPRA